MRSPQTNPEQQSRHEAAIREAVRRGETAVAQRLASEYQRLYSGEQQEPQTASGQMPIESSQQLAAEAARTGGFTSPGGESPWDTPARAPGRAQSRYQAEQVVPGFAAPTREDARRYASIHGEALLNAPASILGLPVDVATGLINLGLRGVSMATGGNRAEIEGAFGGSQFNREQVQRLVEAAGGEMVPRSEMTPEERLGSTLTQLAAEQFAVGSGLATRVGGAAQRSLAPGVQARRVGDDASVTGLVLDEMALPYSQSPITQTIIDAGAVAGTGVALEGASSLVPEDSFFQPYIAILGSVAGGSIGSLFAKGPRATGVAIAESLPDTQLLPTLDANSTVPGLNATYTRGDVNEAARRIQGMASNPQEAAIRLGAALEGFYYPEGFTPPSAATLTEDPGLISLEAGVRVTPEGERVLGARRNEIGVQIQSALDDVVLPDNVRNSYDAGTFTGARQFTDYLEQQAQSLRGAANAEFESAERHVNAAQNYLEAITVGFRTLAEDQQAESSRQAQRFVVDEVLTPRLQQRRALYDRARNSPEAQQTVVDPAEVLQAIGRIQGARSTGRIGPDEVPSRIIADITRRHVPGQAGGGQAQPMTYADMAAYDARLRRARDTARLNENYGLASQIDQLINAISVTEKALVGTDAPAAGLIRQALDYEIGSFAPYFREPGENYRGSVTGSQVYQSFLQNEYGQASATGLRSGGERFLRDVYFNAQVPANQAANELRQIIELAPSPERGLQAANDFLIASASSTLNPDQTVNSQALRRWSREYGAILQVFPEAARIIGTMLGDLEAGEGAIAAAKDRLIRARSGAQLTEREIREGVLRHVIGTDPQNAVRLILGGRDPMRNAREVMSRLSDNDDARRAFQDSVVDYIQRRVMGGAATDDNPAQAADQVRAFNTLFYNTNGALDVIFQGNESALRALENARRIMNDAGRSRGYYPLGVPQGSMRPSMAQSIVDNAELPVRLFYGHLRGGGVMRSLRIALSKIPGIDNETAVNQIIVQSILNPEDLRILLTREGVNEREVSRIMTYARTANAFAMGEQIRQESDNETDGNQ
jgi:hypothetical protein